MRFLGQMPILIKGARNFLIMDTMTGMDGTWLSNTCDKDI